MPARTENEVVAKAKAISKGTVNCSMSLLIAAGRTDEASAKPALVPCNRTEAGSGPALDTSKIEKKHNDTVIREAPTQRVNVRVGQSNQVS